MQDFFNKLYGIENFTTYLIIAIAVLVILFLLILFLGKKDQKLEETKKLQKLSKDTFKEESKKVALDVRKENVDILLPPVNNNVTEPIKVDEDIEPTSVLPNLNDIKEELKVTEVEESKPILEPVEKEEIKIEQPKENIVETNNDSSTFNFDEVVNQLGVEDEVVEKPKFENTQIFSSVFVEKKDEPKIIDIPLKKEENKDIELPKLKEETKEPTEFSLDSLTGESYDIK